MTITLDGTTGITTPGLTNTGTETIATLSVSGAVTLSGGTANGVGYLNGSKVLTSGTALVFDGSKLSLPTVLAIKGAQNGNLSRISMTRTDQSWSINNETDLRFYGQNTDTETPSSIAHSINNTGTFVWNNASTASEQMRLTSTGLGIGTSSPGYKLEVNGGSYLNGNILTQAGSTFYNATGDLYIRAGTGGTLRLGANGSNSLITLSSGGNVVINAPSSGNTLTATAVGTAGAIKAVATTAGSNSFVASPGSATGVAYSFDTNGQVGMYQSAVNNIDFGVLGSSAININSTRNVAINAPSSGITLTLNGNLSCLSNFATGAYHSWQYNGTTNGDIGTGNNAFSGGATGDFGITSRAGNLVLGTGSTERARIDTSGNLLVGTTSTGYTSSNSTYYTPAAAYWISNHQTGTASGTRYYGFGIGVNEVGSITQNGTTGVLFNITSDRRLKDNITDADSASDLIDAIKVRKFDWKSDGSHQRYGMIAQELHEVAPEAVHSPADPDDMMAVDYSKLVPMLVKEIQSLRVRLNALESK